MKKYILFIIALFVFVACSNKHKTYTIGVSQCSEDVWRQYMNDALRTASYQYDNVDMKFVSTQDNSIEQVNQINRLIDEGVDLLIVSPNQMHTITAAIDRATHKGIPVVLFDRKTDSRDYTAFIGADNHKIGRMMGEYVAEALHGKGNIVEIEGLLSSSPTIERHKGFVEAISKYPGLKLIDSKSAGWKQDSARLVMNTMLKKYDHIDCVFGHNDRMALGAREAAEHVGRAKEILFMGIDALPVKGAGMESVRDGKLDASYFYPTRGDLVMHLAMNILQGKPYKKENLLQSTLVTRENAERMLMMRNELASQVQQVEDLHHKIDKFFIDLEHQRVYLFMTIIISILILIIFFFLYRELVRRHQQSKLRAQAKLRFFTDVSHRVRTPLTLIIDPIEQLAKDESIQGSSKEIINMVKRNAISLQKIVEDLLDEEKLRSWVEHPTSQDTSASAQEANRNTQNELNVNKIINHHEECPTILVIDDNEDIRNYIRTILSDSYTVLEAANGLDGLQLARKTVPDLIICDVMMPVMDGLECCQKLKTDTATSHIPVVMLTAKNLDDQRIVGYEHGADAYITKPFNSKLLMVRIDNLLKERTRLRSIFNMNASQEKAFAEGDRTFIGKLRLIIMDNIGNSDFKVEMIGQQVGLSRAQLYRKVKAMTGSSVVDLIKQARLQKAQQLLTTTDMSVSEVAYEVGFTSPSYFTKCFKEEFGKTPQEV